MTKSENINIVERHGCIVCARTFKALAMYTPQGRLVGCVVTSGPATTACWMKAICWSLAIPTQQKKLKLHIIDGSPEMKKMQMMNKKKTKGSIKYVNNPWPDPHPATLRARDPGKITGRKNEEEKILLGKDYSSTCRKENQMNEFKQYRRKGLAEMHPYIPGEDLPSVSVNEVDDPPNDLSMIGRNPKNLADKWYVARKYFEASFKPADV